jgi:hypothetical protein
MPGENYMAGHHYGRGVSGGVKRPWMNITARYRREIAIILARYGKPV